MNHILLIVLYKNNSISISNKMKAKNVEYFNLNTLLNSKNLTKLHLI